MLTLVNNLFGVLELLLLFRILLRLFSANPAAPIVALVYRWTDFLLQPVRFIFPNWNIAGTSVVDVVAIAGMVMYSVLLFVFLKLLRVILSGPSLY